MHPHQMLGLWRRHVTLDGSVRIYYHWRNAKIRFLGLAIILLGAFLVGSYSILSSSGKYLERAFSISSRIWNVVHIYRLFSKEWHRPFDRSSIWAFLGHCRGHTIISDFRRRIIRKSINF